MGAQEAGRHRAGFAPTLRRKLAEKIEQDREAERRDKEAAAERTRRSRPLSRRKIDQKLALYESATALAVSQGSKDPTLGEWRKCSGVPRLVEK